MDPADPLQLLFEQALDPMFVADLDGRLLRTNPAWARTLGWDAESLQRRLWIDLVHPDDREASLEASAQLLKGEGVEGVENRFLCKDGAWRRLRWAAHAKTDAGQIVGVARDVTEEQRLREKLVTSEERFRSIIERTPMGVHLYELDAADRLVLIGTNGAASRFTGIDNAPLVGSSIEEAFPQLAATEIPERYRAVARGEPRFRLHDVPYDDGRICGFFDVEAFNVGARRMAAFFVETTERLRAEAELRASREDLRITLDSIGDAVIATDEAGRVTRMNPVAERLTGWALDEARGRPLDEVFEIVQSTTGARAENPVGRVLASGEIVGLANHTALIARDGTRRHIADSGAPIRDAQGRVVGVVLVFRDVTEEYRLQEELGASEERFRSVVEQAPTGVYLYELQPDDRLVLVEANETAARFTGVAAKDLVGRAIEEAFPRLAETGLPARYREIARGAGPLQLTRLAYDDDRVRGHFDLTAFGFGPGRVAVFFTEVSEHIRAEEELRASREDLRITLESIGDAVIATDAQGRVARMNRVAEQLTGWSSAEAVGRPLTDTFVIVNAHTGEPVNNPVETVLASGEVVGLANHTELIARGGERRQIADSGAPIRNDRGEIVGVVLVFRDVTEEYRLQEQLHHAQKMEAIGQLAGGVAHDFNNLLGGIMGAAEMAALRAADEETQGYLDLILEATGRAAELTQKLLSFSRRGRSQTVPVDLENLVRQVARLLEHTVDRRIGIEVAVDAPGPLVLGDPSQLQSAVLNLGLNARDAMPEGGRLGFRVDSVELDEAGCRRLSADLAPGMYRRVAVEDSGCGVPAELLERIFEPFFTTKEQGRGTGLGLAAVYGVAKAHRGAISVSSTPGSGSVFTLLLPGAHPATRADPGATEAAPAARRSRVLVVDDEATLRRTTVGYLRSLGHSVEEAGDGTAAIALCRAAAVPYDLVVLDLVMPGLGGQETFEAIRAIDPRARVLLVSGHNLKGAGADGLLAQGAAGFLQKPFRLAQLAAAVARALER